VTEVTVKTIYYTERKKMQCPPGYDPSLLPLAKVTYWKGSAASEPMIVSYNVIRERFTRDLNKFFIGDAVLVPKK